MDLATTSFRATPLDRAAARAKTENKKH